MATMSAFSKGQNNPNEEFPILCETCLGENPYVRMTREPHAKACKICDRPFTVYRWKPGPQARYKKTELCHTCAKLKNVCQTCVLDLQFGLPVQVRDSTLEEYEKMTMPTNEVNREYMIEQHEAGMLHVDTGYGKVDGHAQSSQILNKLSRRTPYYKRNLAHICSFFARGACNRGALCPFRHEMPKEGPLAKQNIKDRYFGQNDPVAEKMLSRHHDQKSAKPLEPPADASISTLWVGGIDATVSEGDLRQAFVAHGELNSVRLVVAKQCAFVTFVRRESAESAAKALYNSLTIKGTPLRLAWGKKAAAGGRGRGGGVAAPPGIRGGAGGAPPPPPPGIKSASGGLRPISYPSQDPRNMTATFK
mmetsp:Transcript_45368/g.89197  ORF Transcript_45368/g.89197 Transcript_45368/m.89197 type:complete len:363 (+) Transcript_45368:62-1150(+)